MSWLLAWGILGWLVVIGHRYVDGISRACARTQIAQLQRLKIERDCLAHWLKVNGWQVEFLEDRVVVTRSQMTGRADLRHDPEEARLERLPRRRRR